MIGRYTAVAPGPARGDRASCQADSVKPRREARLGRARRTQRHWGPWHWQVRECNWYLTRMRVMVRPGWPWPGPHSGREYNCRQRRLIPARPWVYLIRVTQVTVESSFNELLSGPWPGQLAVSASGCFTLLQVWSRAARGSFEETYTNLNGMFWIFEIYLQSFTRAAS
jgi:hypothetical protein